MSQSLSLDVPEELIKDPRSWTVEDISVWLHWLGIGEHVGAFAELGVDGLKLLQLSTEASWVEFGVVDPAQQRVLDSAVEPLRCFREVDGTESGLALHAVEGPVAGEIFLVGGGGITGGRHSASNGIVLPENYVSRRHFQITKDQMGQYFLQDIGSTTGTFLMVREELPLGHLMVLQLGTTELTVHMDGDLCTLVATEGPDKGAQAAVPPQGLFMGRDASNNLCIRDPQISAFHGEVRFMPGQGFILDDKYSTNRTWIRLAPDGHASESFPLRVQDLFKVGSTLFHVADPGATPAEPVPSVAAHGISFAAEPSRGGVPISQASIHVYHGASDSGSANEDINADVAGFGAAVIGAGSSQARAANVAVNEGGSVASSEADVVPVGLPLRWEPFAEGQARPALAAAEYARRVSASRRRMHVDGPAQRNGSQDVDDLRERELSSLQQCMRNTKAQTAYRLQEEQNGDRRDEDICKICYDRDIDVVLYPCGHFILCRWCAQKVSDCPLCRFVITNVIRTYKG